MLKGKANSDIQRLTKEEARISCSTITGFAFRVLSTQTYSCARICFFPKYVERVACSRCYQEDLLSPPPGPWVLASAGLLPPICILSVCSFHLLSH